MSYTSKLQPTFFNSVWETFSAGWQHCLVLLWHAMLCMRMTVKTEHPLQDGGAPEYVYHDRTAWRCAVFVGKRYGSKGCEQPVAVATALVTLLSARMMSSTRYNVAGVAISTSRPTRCSSLILVRPSENFCTQLWTAWRDRQCSPYIGSTSLWISFAALSFAHKNRTTPRCSIMVHVLRGAAIL